MSLTGIGSVRRKASERQEVADDYPGSLLKAGVITTGGRRFDGPTPSRDHHPMRRGRNTASAARHPTRASRSAADRQSDLIAQIAGLKAEAGPVPTTGPTTWRGGRAASLAPSSIKSAVHGVLHPLDGASFDSLVFGDHSRTWRPPHVVAPSVSRFTNLRCAEGGAQMVIRVVGIGIRPSRKSGGPCCCAGGQR